MTAAASSDPTIRLTVGQAIVRFLANQWSERDGQRHRLFAGCLGIFGHGNVAGLGQALLEDELTGSPGLPYVLARNEQAMVHTAVGFARASGRLSTWACTSSIGPGATNMLTGAALATIDRIPVLLLPSSTFATRVGAPVLQELEQPYAGDLTVNDAFRPLSRFFDQVERPEQLPAALLGAMRVLTDPADTGAVTISLPQDVQAEAFDWPSDLFAQRVWHIPRPPAEPSRIEAAAALIRAAERPLIVAGGGVHYSGAEQALTALADATGIPVAETQAGKGSLLHGDPHLLGAIGSTGTTAANAAARVADVVIGIGTRWTDFTTASRSAFADPQVRFVNLNIAGFDAGKHSGLSVVADARSAITALTDSLAGHQVSPEYRQQQLDRIRDWDSRVDAVYRPDTAGSAGPTGLLTQAEVIGAVNENIATRDVVVCAAGSMPGDLHKMWRVRDPHGYHLEYGYSCMGYEIPAAIGVRLADPTREVFAMVGDGGYLMMPTELVTAVQEGIKIIVVLVQNNGFGSIGSLSESLGSQRFGTAYRSRNRATGRLDGPTLPIDLVANARSLGASVIDVASRGELVEAITTARNAPADGGPVVIHVRTDPLAAGLDSQAWWDVPVAEVASVDSTRAAHAAYREHKSTQRALLTPAEQLLSAPGTAPGTAPSDEDDGSPARGSRS